MPHVNVYYKMYLPGGHHRQPRNTSIDLSLTSSQGGGDYAAGGHCDPAFFPVLPYTLDGGTGSAQLLFWSVTDGTNGQVLPPMPLDQIVGSSPLTITAWYYPISGPGTGGIGSGVIDDEFSAALGDFLNDTFVSVTSDPTLTGDANVTGYVPTTSPETLLAQLSVASTSEPFSQWILNSSLLPVGTASVNVPAGTDGIAIAVYQSQSSSVQRPNFNPNQYATWQWVDYGTMVDGGPHPWNPYVNQLMVGVALAAASQGVNAKLRGELLTVAVRQIGLAAEGIQKSMQAQIE